MTEQRQFPVPIATDEQVAEFVARYGKPYDPETDDYERDPFIADIREGKNDPIYNAHSYHTKVPPRAIIPYILHYTQPGDIILDPFCGSGMTGVAALMCQDPPKDILRSVPGADKGARRAILNDLSPGACHIAYNYCSPVDVEALKAEFERIKAAVKEEFDWLYGTEHYEPAVGLYDTTNPEVACRLTNPSASVGASDVLSGVERTWQLLARAEVERRLGPRALAEQPLPEDVQQFICIPATIQYTIWSDVYKCQGMVTGNEPTGRITKAGKPGMKKVRRARGCATEIVLWDAAVDHDTGKVQEVFPCPNCALEWKKTQIKRAKTVPVLTNYQWVGLRSADAQRTATTRTARPTASVELDRIQAIEQKQIPWWIPSTLFDTRGPQYRRNALSARQIASVNDLFSRRNLRALAHVWDLVTATVDSGTRRRLQFIFTGIIHRASRLNRLRPSGAGDPQAGTIYVSSLVREENVGRLLAEKQKAVLAGRFAHVGHDLTLVTNCHAGHVCDKMSNVIDYVFADPPFGSNIYYSEVNLLWEAWLGALTDTPFEAVVHRKNDGGTKRLPEYAKLMRDAFPRMYELLKPGRFATIEFNNSDGQVFEAIKQAARDAGFAIENMVFLDKIQKTFKQIKGDRGEEDVAGHDVIFNLRKPGAVSLKAGPRWQLRPGREFVQHRLPDAVEAQAAEAVREHLRTLPDRIQGDPKTYNEEHRTTSFLNTMLMNSLIPRGVDVSDLNLPYIEELCGRYFRKLDNRWYLRDEVVGNHKPHGSRDQLFRSPEQDVVIQDETTAIEWLRQKLTKSPLRIGELRPHWMRATVKLTNDVSTRLEQYLREHFWLDRQTPPLREPTSEERALMDTTERQQARFDAERFLAGSLRRHPVDDEILDWIEHLYCSASLIEEEAAGLSDSGEADELPEGATRLYAMMPRLFQSILKEKVDARKHALAQRQCRIATSKIASRDEEREREKDAARDRERLPLFRDQMDS